MKLIFTKHALNRMQVKTISKDQIIKTIKYGPKTKQTDGLLATYTYIQVAYKIIGDKYIIKTVKVLD